MNVAALPPTPLYSLPLLFDEELLLFGLVVVAGGSVGFTTEMLADASFENLENSAAFGLMEHLIPLLDEKSKTALFGKVLEGELDWHVLKILAPHTLYLLSQAEAAYLDNAIPKEAMDWYWHAYSDEVERMIQARKEP